MSWYHRKLNLKYDNAVFDDIIELCQKHKMEQWL